MVSSSDWLATLFSSFLFAQSSGLTYTRDTSIVVHTHVCMYVRIYIHILCDKEVKEMAAKGFSQH